LQQAELGARQHDDHALRVQQVARGQVQGPAGKLHLLRLLGLRIRRHRVAAAQHAADARQQLARLERLGQVVVGAHLEAEDAVQRLVAGGQHDDRQGRLRAQLAAQGQAVVAGQVQVQHDQVGARFVEHLPHRGAVGGASAR
jgi:transposase-like protein